MRSHCSPSILTWSFGLLLLSVAPAGQAQMDRTIEIMPIAAAPFMAVINVEHIQIKADGSEINLKIREMIARDSQGRVFRDVRPIRSAAEAANPPILFAEIYDPKSNVYIFMNAQRHVYWMGKLAQPPGGLAAGFFFDSPVDENHPRGQFSGDDLGRQTMDGLSVRGVRKLEETTDAAGKSASATREYWYSDDLHMNLMSKYFIPDVVSQTMKVVQLRRGEADARLFSGPLPAGAKRVDTPWETF
jgi:hypothetical protein